MPWFTRNVSRRRFIAALGAALPAPSWAAYPDRPIKLISPFPAGSGSDFVAPTGTMPSAINLSRTSVACTTWASLTQGINDDIACAHARVRDFAQRQRESLHEFEAERIDGLVAGQDLISVNTSGCYVPVSNSHPVG